MKRRKSFLLDLFSRSMTLEYRGYKGLQEVKGLEGVSEGYKGLQVVTGDDKGLQGVTKNYRNFFLTRMFPDTFS